MRIIPTAIGDRWTRKPSYLPAAKLPKDSGIYLVTPLSDGHQRTARQAVQRARKILARDYPDVEVLR